MRISSPAFHPGGYQDAFEEETTMTKILVANQGDRYRLAETVESSKRNEAAQVWASRGYRVKFG
jgi:hypothetical protein